LLLFFAIHTRTTSILLKMIFTAAALLIIQGMTVSARFALPASLPDGHYSGDGTVDEFGFATFTYHGPIDWAFVKNFTESATSLSSDSADTAAVHRRDYGPKCNNRGAPSNIKDAQNAFASYWDNKKFSGSWARTTVGVAMGYACNYGGEQTIHSGDYLGEMRTVDETCGANNAGWFSNYDNWRLNYGRDDVRNNIC
jgi:hypothetical protein